MKTWILLILLALPGCFRAQEKRSITLEDIWTNGNFKEQTIKAINSSKNGEYSYELTDSTLVRRSVLTGALAGVVLRFSEYPELAEQKIEDYQFSADESKVLLCLKRDFIYRHSYTANHYIISLKKHKIQALSANGAQQLPQFSPDGNYVAFVRDNNLFLVDMDRQTETAITTDGLRNHIINGSTDWVYEEEFGISQGFLWSPKSDQIAYLRFDESAVKEFSMGLWGKLYPEAYTYKYPKAGEAISVVSLHVYNMKQKASTAVNVGPEKDQYIPRFKWTSDNEKLAFMRLNRRQNHLEFLVADTKGDHVEKIYEEEKPTYVEVPLDWFFLKDGQRFILTSERQGYNHIFMGRLGSSELTLLTHGAFDVTDLYGVDEKKNVVYYQAAATSSSNRDVCMASLDGRKQQILSVESGFNRAIFTQGFKYYIQVFSDANSPSVYSLHESDGTPIGTLENNAPLKKKFKEYGFVNKVFGVMNNREGDAMPYWIMKPDTMVVGKKYPLLMFVYGGPGSQNVTNSYGRADYLWYQLLVSQGYVVACVDNRGTANRGETYKKSIYLQMGQLETADQMDAAQQFGTMDFIDPQRIGIWGWSYGGFMSTSCLFKGGDIFKMAIAVAPVVTWRYYDNIYTERFMRRPQENAAGYDQNSPINFVDQLKGKYLVIHGTGDDNVHVQNTMDLVTALNEAGKPFEMALYPNKNHSILGDSTRLHLYRRMTEFILRNL